MKDSEWGYLEHMITAINNISEFMTGIDDEQNFVNNKLVRSAVCMELLNFGELVKKTADMGIVSGAEYPWKNIIRFRDRTSHWYHTTDFSIIYKIVTSDMPVAVNLLNK